MTIETMLLTEQAAKDHQAVDVANRLAQLIGSARKTVHIAAYHFSLKDPALTKPVGDALVAAAKNGIEVRVAYYFEHDANFDPRKSGGVTTPTGTEAFLAGLMDLGPIQIRPIAGTHLMHDKYLIVDGHTADATVWTGSTNFTDGAWKFMENNVVLIRSPQLCAFYENDFLELWNTENVKGNGSDSLDTGTVTVDRISVEVDFSPGKGRQMDQLLAKHISAARERIKVSTMVLSSASVLGALADAANHDQVPDFSCIVDGPETTGALHNATGGTPQLFATIQKRLAKNFAMKQSRHYDPQKPDADYNYMHNKILVCDDAVITGSFNFSRNATMNAENILVIQDPGLADKFAAYIDGLVHHYQN